MKMQGRTALVTGASNGIGEQLARQLAGQGANLVLVARREEKLSTLRVELMRSSPQATITVIGADLSEVGATQRLAEQVAGAGIEIDLLVNNAGVGSHEKFADEDPTRVAQMIQLNVGSLVDLTHRFLPGMLARGRGGVLNVASTAAFQPVPTMAVYGATKAFVLSFTEALWAETRDSGVRVLALCPGPTETAFFATTGKKFMTGGRQSAAEVATVALQGLDGRSSSVVSGLVNRLGATGYRFLPRSVITRVSANAVKESA